MRNLGLALLFIANLLAPHAASAKKHATPKHARAIKHAKQKRASMPHARPAKAEKSDHVELAAAVAETREAPRPTPTAAAPTAPSAEPSVSNEPVSMSNQVLDDEVPGSKKRK
jgi:hypothetical protein